jgi:hypothetical protein
VFAGLLGYPIGAALMKRGLWYPFCLAVVVYIARFAFLSFLQETASYSIAQSTERTLPVDEPLGFENTDIAPSVPQAPNRPIMTRILHFCITLDVWNLFKLQGMMFLFVSYLVKKIGFASQTFIFHYASELLSKNLLETFLLRVFNHLGMLLTLGAILPWLAWKSSTAVKEIWVIRVSILCAFLGFLILWMGRSMAALSIGTLLSRVSRIILTCK